ncbi:hypothetical protein YC2023_030382 [Brassica napus]
MVKATWVSILALAAFLLVVLVPAAEAVTCSPMQLSPCAAAITSSSPPSALCCAKLKEQKPCICGYMRNPSLRRYISSPNARKVSNTCKFPMPRAHRYYQRLDSSLVHLISPLQVLVLIG